MRFDALTHITSDGSWFHTGLDASLEKLSAMMENENIARAVVSGLPGIGATDCLLRAQARHPDKLMMLYGWETADHADISDRLADLKKQGFAGIKIHPRLLNLALNDPILENVLAACGTLGLTVYLCSIIKHPAPLPKEPLAYVIGRLCRNHPDCKIVLAHGGYDQILSVSEQIRPFENVLLDLSCTALRFATTSVANDIAFLLRTFDRRLCVGSDFPEATFAQVVGALVKMGFTETDLEKKGVLGNNLARFLDFS